MSGMAPNYQSTSTAGVENLTPRATLPVTLPLSVGNGPSSGPGQHPLPSPAPAPPYIEHDSDLDLEVVGHGSMTPPPSYAESILGLIIGDAKTLPCAYNSSLPSLRYGPNPNKQDDHDSLHIGAPEAPSSLALQRLCDPYRENDSAGPDTTSLIQVLLPTCCSTNSTTGPRDLNFHVSTNNYVYRWRTTDIPIPVGIDFSSFESCEQASMVQRCFITVLDRFNANNVGPKFQFVHDPFHSAFFVRFGGDYPRYANSFFPDSHPKDWYIDIFKAGLILSAEQDQFLMNTRGRDICAARSRALEQNLVNILTHEMMHVVGVRHCDAHLAEKAQPCVRFPPDLTDDENNEEHLMQRMIHWKDLPWIDWKSRTLEEIRQIYVEERKYIGRHKIRDVSWQAGAEERRRIAMSIVRCCNPKPQDKQ